MILIGMSLKVMVLFLDSSLMIFIISSRWNSRMVTFSFAIKMLLNPFDRFVFECLSRSFKGLFFGAGEFFFNFRVSVKFVKYLFKVCDIFLLPDYSMILKENISIYGFAFIRKMGFDGHPEFFSACNTIEA